MMFFSGKPKQYLGEFDQGQWCVYTYAPWATGIQKYKTEYCIDVLRLILKDELDTATTPWIDVEFSI